MLTARVISFSDDRFFDESYTFRIEYQDSENSNSKTNISVINFCNGFAWVKFEPWLTIKDIAQLAEALLSSSSNFSDNLRNCYCGINTLDGFYFKYSQKPIKAHNYDTAEKIYDGILSNIRSELCVATID